MTARMSKSNWPSQSSRMRDELRDRGRLVFGRQVGIPQRHLDIRVAQQLADGVEVNPRHDQPRREGVPQVVKAKVAPAASVFSGTYRVRQLFATSVRTLISARADGFESITRR